MAATTTKSSKAEIEKQKKSYYNFFSLKQIQIISRLLTIQ